MSRHQLVDKNNNKELLCERADLKSNVGLILRYLNPVSNNRIPAEKAEN